MEVILHYPIWLPMVFVMGACVGSFLNVVIYRVPRGLSVNNPRRSFCPKCRKDIPWFRNIPILTWVLQGGKCAECRAPIAIRYVLVEIVTAVLFLAGWYVAIFLFPVPHLVPALLIMVLAVLLVSIGFIDAEYMVIPVVFCWWGMAIGVVGSSLDPLLTEMMGGSGGRSWWQGGLQGLLGLAAGWGVLAMVVILGKVFLGERRETFEEPEEWFLRDPEGPDEELSFVLGDEHMGWTDLFYRKSDRIEIEGHGILVDGVETEATAITIHRDFILLGEERHELEKLRSLSGKAEKVGIPREAMGAGDPPLLGMIGAFIGWQGVLFTLFASCFYALIAAALGRIGFGRALPFGPFLALGGITWIFGGWKIWSWYFNVIGGL